MQEYIFGETSSIDVEVPTFSDDLSVLYDTEGYCGEIKSEMIVKDQSSGSEDTDVDFATYDEDYKEISVTSDDQTLIGKTFKFRVRLWLADYTQIEDTYDLFTVTFRD